VLEFINFIGKTNPIMSVKRQIFKKHKMAIEKNEKDAQSWIDGELKKLNVCLE
jgi:hypothetical protein